MSRLLKLYGKSLLVAIPCGMIGTSAYFIHIEKLPQKHQSFVDNMGDMMFCTTMGMGLGTLVGAGWPMLLPLTVTHSQKCKNLNAMVAINAYATKIEE